MSSGYIRLPVEGGGGGGAVDSVNGQTGVVNLDTADIPESGATNRYYTPARESAKQDTITGAASTVTTTNLPPSTVLISNLLGKIEDSSFLKVNEDEDKKELIFGDDTLYQYGQDIAPPEDNGSAIEYNPSYVYPATIETHEMEIYQYWTLNGIDVVSQFGPGYISLMSDGSEKYQIQWEWTDNVAPDGYFLVKYDSSPYSGLHYAQNVGNIKSFLEDFTDWSTLPSYVGFNTNPTLFNYAPGNAYPADTQTHYLEVRAFRYVSGNKLYGNVQYFDGTADGSDNYNIQWAWCPVPNIDGYTITKYDDTWSGQYSVDVLTNTFLEDFTDWSTKDPTPNFINDRQETQYIISPYSGFKGIQSSVEKIIFDYDGPIIPGVNQEAILRSAPGGRIEGSSIRIVEPSILTTDSNLTVQNSGISTSTTIRSGFSQPQTGVSSGPLVLETRAADNRTNDSSPPPINGTVTIRSGNGSNNFSAGTYVTGGQAGQIELRGGTGGSAQNGTQNNQGAEGGRINLVAGNGGNGIGMGSTGGPGSSFQAASGVGGNCISSGPNQTGSASNGGDCIFYANNGGQLTNINGTTGSSGNIFLFTGIAYPSNFAGSAAANTGGRGGDVNIRASAGGNAANSTVANNGGRAGQMNLEVQRGGDADTTPGNAGQILLQIARPGKNSTDTAQGLPGNIVLQPSPAAYSGAAEGIIGLATNSAGTKIGKVAIGHVTPSALLDVSGDVKLGTTGTVFQAIVSATAVLDFPSINSNRSAELTMSVPGAQVGASVHLGAPASLELHLIAFAFVSAQDTVTVRLYNSDSSSIDPASATWRATVFNF
jgi:hypothetical protein